MPRQGPSLPQSDGALEILVTPDNGIRIVVDNGSRQGVNNMADIIHDEIVSALADLDAAIATVEALPPPQRLQTPRGNALVNDGARGSVLVVIESPESNGIKRRCALRLARARIFRDEMATAIASLKIYEGR